MRRRNGLLVGRRQRPGREAEPRHVAARRAQALGHLGRALAELERPDRVGGVHLHGAVARDARRPCVARDRSADDLRPALDELGHAGLRAEAAQLGADLATERIHAPPRRVARARSAARRVRRSDHRLAHARDALRENAAPAEVELREHVVEQQQRRRRQRAPPRRAAARARRAAARPASRTGAGRGRRSRSSTSSRCGPSPVVPRSRSRARRASRSAAVGGSAS